MKMKESNAIHCNSEKNVFQKIWKAKGCYLGLIPTFIFLFVFSLYPSIEGLLRSFYKWKTANYFSPTFNGLDNYIRLFQDAEFWKGFGFLALLQVVGFIKTFLINLPCTYFIYRLIRERKGRFFQRAFVIPMMIPGMVSTMYWRFFFQHGDGILDSILTLIGLGEHGIIWLADKVWTVPAMIFTGFPWIGGLPMLILMAGMLNIDPTLEEAAKVDGANGVQIFFKIYFPLLIPQMKVLSILGIIAELQNCNMQLIYTSGNYGTMVPAYYMYESAFVKGNYGYAAAQGVVLFIIILFITMLQQKFIKKAD